MASIIDEFELNKENLEKAIGYGATKKQIEIMFRKSSKELDVWCGEEYGCAHFCTVYDMIRTMVINKYLGVMSAWAERGHSSAMNIVTNFLIDTKKTDTVKIVFGNDLATEEEDDKEDE